MQKNMFLVLSFLIILTGCSAYPDINIDSKTVEIPRTDTLPESDFLKYFNIEVSDKDNATSELKVSVDNYDSKSFNKTKSIQQSQKVTVTDPDGNKDSGYVYYKIVKSKDDQASDVAFKTNLKLTPDDVIRLQGELAGTQIENLAVANHQCELNEEVNDQFLQDIEDGLDPETPDNLYTDECYKTATVIMSSDIGSNAPKSMETSYNEEIVDSIVNIVTDQSLQNVEQFIFKIKYSNGIGYYHTYTIKGTQLKEVRSNPEAAQEKLPQDIVTGVE